MSTIKLSAQKVKDQSNLRIIAEAWKTLRVEKGFEISWGSNMLLDMVVCYAGGYDKNLPMSIADPHVYVSSADRYASPIVGESVLGNFPGGSNGTAFALASNFLTNGNNGFIFSYCLISVSGNVPSETTPIAFTRGLTTSGLWDEKVGLYGSKGGFVAFADGHVTWFDGSKPAKFLKWDGTGYTSNIAEALPEGILIIAGAWLQRNLTSKDGSTILIDYWT
jgi:prepilin-type processing-associated H-X9-DG protein